MARRATRQAGPTPVDSITHGDKRKNIPTADAHAFVDPAIEEVREVRYARDESLDPQLVWRGKYPPAEELGEADDDLVTDAPPIYIQEKIDPRVLIESLRRTAESAFDGERAHEVTAIEMRVLAVVEGDAPALVQLRRLGQRQERRAVGVCRGHRHAI